MMSAKHSVTLSAPAKVNLSLVVFGKRPDGFHDLHTVMATTSFEDHLCISVSDDGGIVLRCTGLGCPTGGENLVFRAATLLGEHVGRDLFLSIHLHKHIPAGAGLGGASSDAAACLAGVNELLDLQLSREELASVAAQLGSDVPFFLYGPTAVCTGRGEMVSALPQRLTGKLLLLLPGVHVSTAAVYGAYRHDPVATAKQMNAIEAALGQEDLMALAALRVNSLTAPCLDCFGELAQLRERVEALGVAPLQLSGSGSTFFALPNSDDELSDWVKILQESKVADFRVVEFLGQQNHFPEVHHADN